MRPKQNLPCENHECLPVIGAGGELSGVGVQHGQAQLEVGFDAVEEEAVDHADGAEEGQDAEEEGEEPGEGDGGEGGEVWNVLGQLRQTLPDQLLEHRLVHLSSCRGGEGGGGISISCVCSPVYTEHTLFTYILFIY